MITMNINLPLEIYRIKLFMKSGDVLHGFVPRAGDVDGYWLRISRTEDLENATYINKHEVAYFELSENK